MSELSLAPRSRRFLILDRNGDPSTAACPSIPNRRSGTSVLCIVYCLELRVMVESRSTGTYDAAGLTNRETPPVCAWRHRRVVEEHERCGNL